ncbi:MAG TPA: hypothetical protein VG269_26805 [Tepidisphaeraceae bacterium]|jgi:hypothetical protein|nr:hypothetical protein [Tepidisphaeraceae bacterium]
MPRAAAPKPIPLPFPINGITTVAGFTNQPKGTCRDALNVVPFEPTTGSGRGGQRAGLSRLNGGGVTLGGPTGGSAIQLLTQGDLPGEQTYTGVAYSGAVWQVNYQLYPGGHRPITVASAGVYQGRTHASSFLSLLRTDQGAADDSTFVFTGSASNGSDSPGFQPAAGRLAGGAYYTQNDNSSPISGMGVACIDGKTSGSGASNFLPVGGRFWATLFCNSTPAGTAPLAVSVSMRDRRYVEIWGPTDTITPTLTHDLGAALTTYFSFGFVIVPTTGNQAEVRVGAVGNGDPNFAEPTKGTIIAKATISAYNNGGQSFAFGVEGATAGGEGTINGAGIGNYIQTLGPVLSRNLQLVAVANGTIYQANGAGGVWVVPTGGDYCLQTTQIVQGDSGQGKVIIVDGTSTKVVDLRAETVSDLVADADKGTVPAGCRLCLIWRDRLILANQPGFEQNLYFSRAGVYTDWLYGQDDALTAISLNDSPITGRVGDPVTALVATTDDFLLISTDHSLFACVGDPGANGSISVVSGSVGILGAEAWTVDPIGRIYFVGNGGFFAFTPGHGFQTQYAEPVNLAQEKVAKFFENIDRSRVNISCQWDRDRHGCFIFITPLDGVTPGTHLWFDERTQGFWKLQYPASVGPYVSCIFDGDGPTDRQILLGGVDGVVYKTDPSATSDDGVPISSYVYIGPVALADAFNTAQVIGLECVLGSDLGAAGETPNVDYAVLLGADAEEAFTAAPAISGTFTQPGRQPRVLTRGRGNTAYLKLSNSVPSTVWAFERAAAVTLPGGPLR